MSNGVVMNVLALLVGLGYSWGGLFPYSIPYLVKFPDYLCSSSDKPDKFECDWKYVCKYWDV